MKFSQTGLLRCARYSFAPNHFHYCGPDRQTDMFDYVSNGISDGGLGEILNRFDTLYKYLVLIASQNGISDPFDQRVVEAYWLGNSLLKKVKIRPFAQYLKDTLELKKKAGSRKLESLLMKTADGVPHHAFHVLNVFIRTGHHTVPYSLSTMDNCRISWGKVVNINKLKKSRSAVIETQPLVYEKDLLKLGNPVRKEVISFVDLNLNNWVSVHWGFVCERLNRTQIHYLKLNTLQAVQLANRVV